MIGALKGPSSTLPYVDIDSLEEGVKAMGGARLLLGPRTTFYGAREAWFTPGSDHVVAFAEEAKSAG